jgi:hypothetical protein
LIFLLPIVCARWLQLFGAIYAQDLVDARAHRVVRDACADAVSARAGRIALPDAFDHRAVLPGRRVLLIAELPALLPTYVSCNRFGECIRAIAFESPLARYVALSIEFRPLLI